MPAEGRPTDPGASVPTEVDARLRTAPARKPIWFDHPGRRTGVESDRPSGSFARRDSEEPLRSSGPRTPPPRGAASFEVNPVSVTPRSRFDRDLERNRRGSCCVRMGRSPADHFKNQRICFSPVGLLPRFGFDVGLVPVARFSTSVSPSDHQPVTE